MLTRNVPVYSEAAIRQQPVKAGRKEENMERNELSHQAIWTFRRADGMLRRYMDRKVGHTGVFPTQHRLLMELGRNPGISQIELAEKFEVSAAAITVSLKKLENGGYISRLVNREDNRSNQVSITEKGRGVIERSILIFQEADRCFFDGFSDEEIVQFMGYMERVYENMAAENGRLDKEGEQEE